MNCFEREQQKLADYIDERDHILAELEKSLLSYGFRQEGSLRCFYKGNIRVCLFHGSYGGCLTIKGNIRNHPRWRDGTIRMVNKAIRLAAEEAA